MLSRFGHVWLCDSVDCSPPDSSVMGFSRQEYWSGWPCPPPGDLPVPGIKPMYLKSPTLAGGFFTTSATWEARERGKQESRWGVKRYRFRGNKGDRWEKDGVIFWRKCVVRRHFLMLEERQKPVVKSNHCWGHWRQGWQQLFPESGFILMGTRGLGAWLSLRFKSKTFKKLFKRHCHFLI